MDGNRRLDVRNEVIKSFCFFEIFRLQNSSGIFPLKMTNTTCFRSIIDILSPECHSEGENFIEIFDSKNLSFRKESVTKGDSSIVKQISHFSLLNTKTALTESSLYLFFFYCKFSIFHCYYNLIFIGHFSFKKFSSKFCFHILL